MRCVRISTIAAALLAAVLPASAASADAQKPNVVLIVSDDQGYHDLACFGSDEVLTPHLDRLAAGGVRLTNFYVTWPACTPSRGSLLTGRYPQRNGVYDMIRNEAPDYGHRYTRPPSMPPRSNALAGWIPESICFHSSYATPATKRPSSANGISVR